MEIACKCMNNVSRVGCCCCNNQQKQKGRVCTNALLQQKRIQKGCSIPLWIGSSIWKKVNLVAESNGLLERRETKELEIDEYAGFKVQTNFVWFFILIKELSSRSIWELALGEPIPTLKPWKNLEKHVVFASKHYKYSISRLNQGIQVQILYSLDQNFDYPICSMI